MRSLNGTTIEVMMMYLNYAKSSEEDTREYDEGDVVTFKIEQAGEVFTGQICEVKNLTLKVMLKGQTLRIFKSMVIKHTKQGTIKD